MHELSLAQDILKAVLDEAEKAGGKRVTEIRATVRESIHHMEDLALDTCLDAIARGTIAEGAKIKIELIPPTLRCRECDFTFTARESTLICPHCRGSKLEELDAEEIDLDCNFAE